MRVAALVSRSHLVAACEASVAFVAAAFRSSACQRVIAAAWAPFSRLPAEQRVRAIGCALCCALASRVAMTLLTEPPIPVAPVTILIQVLVLALALGLAAFPRGFAAASRMRGRPRL